MFDDNENSYPIKPDLLKNKSRRLSGFILMLGLLVIISTTSDYTSVYVWLFEVSVVLLIHELGHYAMMRIFKIKAQGLFFMSFIGNLDEALKASRSQKQQAIINLMGPVPGILIGSALFMYCVYNLPNVMVLEFALLFLGINILNLAPINPFDGGRIVGGFFFYQNDRLRMVFTLVSSFVLIGLGVYFDLFIPLIVFGFLMGLKVRSYQKSNLLHEQLEEGNVNYKKKYEDLTNGEYWKIRAAFLVSNPKLREMIPSGLTLWDNEPLLVEQVRQLLRVDIKEDTSLIAKIGFLLLMGILITLPIVMVYLNYDLISWYLNSLNV